MEQKRKLNTTDEWEGIVNANYVRSSYERSIADKIERERSLRKLWLKVCGLATIGLTFVILGFAGAVAGWLTVVISGASVIAGTFVFGRYVEVKKR